MKGFSDPDAGKVSVGAMDRANGSQLLFMQPMLWNLISNPTMLVMSKFIDILIKVMHS